MKKILITSFLIVSIFAFSNNLQAIGYSGSGELGQLLFWESHTGLLIRHQNMVDSDGCGRSDWYILSNDYPHFKEVYAMLLMAKATNKRVSLTLTGCLQGLPKVRHVQLID